MHSLTPSASLLLGLILPLISPPSPADAALQDSATGAVLLQGFHWESHETYPWWGELQSKASLIGDAGFEMVWLPPSSASADVSYEGYLPNELYTQSGYYGSEGSLKVAISALHDEGVLAIADIVINHRVGTFDWGDFSNPTWGTDAVCGDDEWPSATGNADTGSPYGAARDIDHTQGYVRQSIKDWLGWMQGELGYDGYRFDYAKGFAGGYVGEYVEATSPAFSVGEYWDDLDLNNPNPHRQRLANWVNATGGRSAVFDFTTKGILQQAFSDNSYWRLQDNQGRPSGLMGWWPSKSVTFLDNHDTGPSPGGGQNHWPFPGDRVLAGYAYILSHPGIPTVYWPHFFDWGLGGEITELMNLRDALGINSESEVEILKADGEAYGAIIDDVLALRLGGGSWSPGAGFEFEMEGPGFAIWTRADTTPTPTPTPGSGDLQRTVIYLNMATVPGQDIYIRGGHDEGLVQAGLYPEMFEPIRYLNTLNQTTAPTKSGDDTLDWFSDSALDWTTDSWPMSWGAEPHYAIDGYGVDPENDRGPHWWKFDVEMTGEVGDWFEFKAFLRQGAQTTWEGNIYQSGTPQASINHWARVGYITWVSFNQSWVEMEPLAE